MRAPLPTSYSIQGGLGVCWGPKTTSAPQPAKVELRIRQVTAGATPSTCGWVDSDESNPVTCAPDFFCGTTQQSIVGCCHSTTGSQCREIVTTCYDFVGPACGSACQQNTNNLICSAPNAYCALYKYPGGSLGYGCAPTAGYTRNVALTHSNSNMGGSLTGIPTPTSVSRSLTASAPTLTNPTAPTTPQSSHLSGGAIAGIAIGSVFAVIGFLLAIALLVYLRRRRQAAPQAYPAYSMYSTPQPPHGSWPPTAGFSPPYRSTTPQELQRESSVHELDSNHRETLISKSDDEDRVVSEVPTENPTHTTIRGPSTGTDNSVSVI